MASALGPPHGPTGTAHARPRSDSACRRVGARRRLAAAQVAALLAGDVDAFPRVTPRSVPQFKTNPRFQVVVSGSRAKTILAINNGKKPLDDVRVRRAIAAAIDRKAVIEGAGDGYGAPIGSHYVPGAFGYVDTTGVNPYDPEKAKKLLAEAGIKTPLELTMTLPPTPRSSTNRSNFSR